MAISIEDWRVNAKHFEFDGVRIAYWMEGTGKPLLLIHGFPTASYDWAPVWKQLKSRHTLIAADMIGFGLSEKPQSGYSIHRQADMLEALLEHLKISEYDSMVHDYGASVGQELLARQQEDSGAEGLHRMIFLNGGVFPRELRNLALMRVGRSPFKRLISKTMNRKRFGRNFAKLFGPQTKPSEDWTDICWALFSADNGHQLFHELVHFIADREDHEDRWVGALHKAQERIGMINGGADPVSGEHVFRRWVDNLPQANEHFLPSVGHYPQVESPAEVASTTLAWLG